ncbi:hypothetical protein Aperf_G00000088389 [Anoplocephala perfoliata]
MEVGNVIDLSLDEIIKLNKKSKQPSAAKAGPSGKKRVAIKKKSAPLRANLSRPMKSRQITAAQVAFRRARRTAAIAAKAAADALALVAPSTGPGNNERGVGVGGVSRNNRPMNRSSVARNQMLLRQQQRRRTRGTQDLRSRLNFPIQRQRRPPIQQAQSVIGRRSVNLRARYRKPIRGSGQRLVTTTVARGSWQNASVPKRPMSTRGGALNRALPNNVASRGPAQYQQYIQQARALIRAQQELRDSSLGNATRNRSTRNSNNNSNIYVDVPVRNTAGGFTGNRGRGRGRGASRGGRFRR